jgi:urocanate hydratase
VCTSNLESDLHITDEIAAQVIFDLSKNSAEIVQKQYNDNYLWIKQADSHKLVVGSQARILYSDANGRVSIALAFNNAIKDGKLKGPIVISRDHHDVSGTDSPYRETSNIMDGSSFCAGKLCITFSKILILVK